jgi:CBS domain containing-hemolysin-like protein
MGVRALFVRLGLLEPPAATEPDEGGDGDADPHDAAELEAVITRCLDRGQLRAPSAQMLRRVLYLAGTTAAEVMTPRTEVIGIREHTPLDEAAAFILEHGHSRYPLFRDAKDNVAGVVLARDVWRAQAAGGGESLADLAREAFYVPDTKPLDDLLREMQQDRNHMAIVIDEFGGTAGVVTIEDVIEEIVGDIADELDDAPVELERGNAGEIIVPGGLPIAELNERFALELPDEDYTTVGGFVMGRLGRMAHAGDVVQIRDGHLRVLGVRKRRIERIALERAQEGGPG